MNALDRITWQPKGSVRIAAVVKHFSADNSADQTGSSGFVVVGRNMREVEDRENRMLILVGAATVALLIISFIATIFTGLVSRRLSSAA